MKILSFESSAVSAAVCLTDGRKVVAASFQNCGLTHSRTLLPMAENLLAGCGMTLSEIDGFAVAAGPGSFTGLRIGVATVKGLAFGLDRPCLGVSTLEAMARGLEGLHSAVCAVMDARAGQVYNAMFSLDGTAEGCIRLTEDRAIALDELAQEIGDRTQILVGDGADLCYTRLIENCSGLRLAPPQLRYPAGYGVAMTALPRFQRGEGVSAQALDVIYLRPPQAVQARQRQQSQQAN